jgi:hypothetical protein
MKQQMGSQKATTEKIHDMVTLFDYLPTFFTGTNHCHMLLVLSNDFRQSVLSGKYGKLADISPPSYCCIPRSSILISLFF